MPPNAPLKSEYDVYMFCLDSFASSYIVMCVDRLSYMFRWERNPSAVSLNIPSDSAVYVPIVVKIDVQILSMHFMRAMGYVARRVVWVGFVGFVYTFCGTNAPFPRRVSMFGYYLEEYIYEVVGCVR